MADAPKDSSLPAEPPLETTETVIRGAPGTPPAGGEQVQTPATVLADGRAPWRAGLPRHLGAYDLLAELGQGGMGIVCKARHRNLGTFAAVKVLIAGEHASPEELARFQLEAAAVARMGKHPNIVTVYDYATEGSLAYYAMELVEGTSLSSLLRKREFAPQETAALMEKVARALHFAHQHQIIHRDLKPDNIVVREDPSTGSGQGLEPQVMDFGLAREVGTLAGKSIQGSPMGTPNYMAPEQAQGEHEQCNARTDVYGLGGILYEMLTGNPPHPGRSWPQVAAHILSSEVVPPRHVRPETSKDLETVCLKCLEREQGARYATAEALADDLRRFLRGEPVVARPIGPIARMVRRVRRHPLVSSLIAVSAVFALGLAWRFLGPAKVTYTVDPSNATVEAIGTSLSSGGWVWPARSFRLRVTHEGYLPREVQVTATAGASIRLETIHLDSVPGTLEVTGEPREMSVVVWDLTSNRERTRLSPPTTLDLPPGSYELRASLALHFPRVSEVEVQRGATIKADLSLARQTLWTHEMGSLTRDRAALGDLDGDGSLDCVVGSDNGRVSALSGSDGAVLWSYETGARVDSSPELGDLRAIGHLDCVVGSGSKVCALSGSDGSLLWAREIGPLASSPIALGDLSGRGGLDCLVVTDKGRVYALSGRDGSVLWVTEPLGSVDMCLRLGDLRGSGGLDCVVTAGAGVRALSGKDGSVLWGYAAGCRVLNSPALGDLHGDGSVDCVVKSGGRVDALAGKDGAVLWEFRIGDEMAYRTTHERGSPVLADLKGDGHLDCVVGCGKRVCALSGRDGTPLWSRETDVPVDCPIELGDLRGRGSPDCVVGSSGKVCALSGSDGSLLWTQEAGGYPVLPFKSGRWMGSAECFVTLGTSVRALSGTSGAVLRSYDLGANVVSDLALGDLKGDGSIDCVVASQDRKLYALSSKEHPFIWAREMAGPVSAMTPTDKDRDHHSDLLVSCGKEAYTLSGKDGAVLHVDKTADGAAPSPLLGDLRGDGQLDRIVVSDSKVRALSERDGKVLWEFDTHNQVYAGPDLADLNGDGRMGCVVGTYNGVVYALSGKDGAVLWSYDLDGEAEMRFALGDLRGGGGLDCVVGANGGELVALSGRDGAKLWELRIFEANKFPPMLADLDGDGGADCIVVSGEKVHAFSGSDGALLWTCEPGGGVAVAPVLRDIDGDGALDCVVVSRAGRIQAIQGQDPKGLRAAERLRLGGYRREGRWSSLAQLAAERLAEGKKEADDAWVRATTWIQLGVARVNLDQPQEALDAFAEASRLHLRAPDAAVYGWIASRSWEQCPADRRKQADRTLLEAFLSEPESVFDLIVESRDFPSNPDAAELRSILDQAATQDTCFIERVLLIALPPADGKGPRSPDAALAAPLAAARTRIAMRIEKGEGTLSRNMGYLALITGLLRDPATFASMYATYLDLPHRPASLDVILPQFVPKR